MNHYGVLELTPPGLSQPSIKLSDQNNKDHLANNENLLIDPNCYQQAEVLALDYFKTLSNIASQPNYLTQLTKDFSYWSNNSENTKTISTLEQQLQQQLQQSSNGSTINSLSFLQKLSIDNQLKDYLTKSITYLFMRDLGKSTNESNTKKQIKSIVSKIQTWVRKQPITPQKPLVEQNFIEQKAKEYEIEDTLIWLKTKLALLQANMPDELDKTNGLRKLVKIIAGVVLHQLIDLPKDSNSKTITQHLKQSIKQGYYYGITYPFIDDLQDSSTALNRKDKTLFNQAIRQSLLQGKVTDFPEFSAQNNQKMQFVYKELKTAFDAIKSAQSTQAANHFFQQAFIFFEAQDIDRQRRLNNQTYSDQSIYIPLILKSAGCRLIAKEIIDSNKNNLFDFRTLCFGIYNQFNDDIKDIFDDLKEGNVTPYSYYLTHKNTDHILENQNPYRIYWSVVFYLIHHVYQNEGYAKKLLLERSINAHKSLLNVVGEKEYQKLESQLLTTGDKSFDNLIAALVRKPNSVAWFDKLISREVSNFFSQQEVKTQQFKDEYYSAQQFIDNILPLANHRRIGKTQLVEASNYSLNAGGKRMRSVLAFKTLTQRYNFAQEHTKPILQLLEYMHTASLIFDDKPSQDNANLRRGKPSLHEHCNSEAKAELAGVYLMMKAVEVQTTIQNVAAENVLASLQYAANTTQAICEGQLLDLQSNNKRTDLSSLKKISFLKTGLAIEAAILIPAILAGENDIEKEHLKKFAYYLGLVFQIKDDLLDLESSELVLGKPTNQDSNLNKASFVTLLGEEKAQLELQSYYQKAKIALQKLNNPSPFYQQLLDLVIYRHH